MKNSIKIYIGLFILIILIIQFNPFVSTIAPVNLINLFNGFDDYAVRGNLTNLARGEVLDDVLSQWLETHISLKNNTLSSWKNLGFGSPKFMIIDPIINPFFWVFHFVALLTKLEWFAYNFYIILKITICFFGTFLFVNNYFKKIPALFAAISFTFCDFNSFWIFWQHTDIAFLIPYSLYFIDKYFENNKIQYLFALSFFTLFALTGGFPQMSVIFASVCGSFTIFKLFTKKRKKLINFLKLSFTFLIPLFICAGFIVEFKVYLDYMTSFNSRKAFAHLDLLDGLKMFFNKYIEKNHEIKGYQGLLAPLISIFVFYTIIQRIRLKKN